MPDIVIPPGEIDRRHRLRILAVMAVVGLIVVSLFVVWRWTPQGPSVSAADILLGTVKAGNFVVRVRAPGELRPRKEQWVTSRVAGTILDANVYPGSVVTPDSVLLTLRNPNLKIAVLKADANLASTKARAATEASHLKGELLALEGRLGSEMAKGQALMMKVRAEKHLYMEHVISRLQFETDQLEARNTKDQARLLEQRIVAFKSDLVAERQSESSAVAAARATLLQAKLDEASLVVRAGISGVVQAFHVDPGQAIAAGTAVARIANPRNLETLLDVGPESARELADGQGVEILIEGNGRSIVRGRITRISPNVVGGVVPVTVRITTPLPPGARPNLAVSGVVTVATIAHAVYVERPVGAQPQTRASVFVVSPGGKRAIRTPVQFGVASTEFIQIVSGLTPGQRVVVSETRHWRTPMRIR
ncbi:efflux RND transporter periplasmic adaptor subunit [Acidiferrobacter thiooxydans]|uniref:efflux RND transporter periplasmic adaptor subunit n=1 Tax=Acidiferrobacter thiooxydans TaxID=163359 RepID=UPI0011472341|nr:HlyD family efflux transporter periplasmic adaptor subunit [Acidiferrobacter thiooxydans]UEO01199.1 HlyD family efflux transporter periplasmic adaptor subunit [Acidiferrobacter thiooxydans]